MYMYHRSLYNICHISEQKYATAIHVQPGYKIDASTKQAGITDMT